MTTSILGAEIRPMVMEGGGGESACAFSSTCVWSWLEKFISARIKLKIASCSEDHAYKMLGFCLGALACLPMNTFLRSLLLNQV